VACGAALPSPSGRAREGELMAKKYFLIIQIEFEYKNKYEHRMMSCTYSFLFSFSFSFSFYAPPSLTLPRKMGRGAAVLPQRGGRLVL
jgi:hypothetical protein